MKNGNEEYNISPFHSQAHTEGCCQSHCQHCLCTQTPQSLAFLCKQKQKRSEITEMETQKATKKE